MLRIKRSPLSHVTRLLNCETKLASFFSFFFCFSLAFKPVCFRLNPTYFTSLHAKRYEFDCWPLAMRVSNNQLTPALKDRSQSHLPICTHGGNIASTCYQGNWMLIRKKRGITMNKLAAEKKKNLYLQRCFLVGVFHRQEEIALFSFSFFFRRNYPDRNKLAMNLLFPFFKRNCCLLHARFAIISFCA